MQHVDTLSRQPKNPPRKVDSNVMALKTRMEDWSLSMQILDDKVKSIKEILKRGPQTSEGKPVHADYEVKNELKLKKILQEYRWNTDGCT